MLMDFRESPRVDFSFGGRVLRLARARRFFILQSSFSGEASRMELHYTTVQEKQQQATSDLQLCPVHRYL